MQAVKLIVHVPLPIKWFYLNAGHLYLYRATSVVSFHFSVYFSLRYLH